jgi:hypothetical protein
MHSILSFLKRHEYALVLLVGTGIIGGVLIYKHNNPTMVRYFATGPEDVYINDIPHYLPTQIGAGGSP